jgi:competence protein ComEA
MAMTRRQWMRGAAAVAACAVPGMAMAAAPTDAPREKSGAARDATSQGKAQKVNLHEASKAELMKLDGVGAGAAERIIAYREAHGPFKRVQDLERVDKVGKMVLEKNAGRLAVK